MRTCVKAVLWFLLIGSLTAVQAQIKTVERIPTPFIENGQAISMEAVVFKPAGQGPFPALLFLHGSTGRGNIPRLFKDTYTLDSVVNQFVSRGWMVVFPQRRGRGQSGGLYDEGFDPDRTRYSCTPSFSLPGIARALEDTRVAADWLISRPDVDPKRLLIGGQSRGGILSVAFTGQQPQTFKGAINFVGGWVGCRDAADRAAINTVTFEEAAKGGTPTIWLYGRDDPFYSIEHSKSNFDAFVAKGGQGTFHVFNAPPAGNGHGIGRDASIWQEVVWNFVNKAVP